MFDVCFKVVLVERFDMGAWDEEWSDLERERERERERCFQVLEREEDARVKRGKASQNVL